MSTQTIGRYEIERELGKGGMAVVYLARDPYMKRPVAVKVLPRQFTFDEQFRTRFQREAEIIAALEHPYIVPVHDYGEHEEQPFIVMRYMPGGSLLDRMARGPLGLTEISRIVSRVAEALDEAHARHIVHRDLKPGNILFDARGDAFLSDFGIAKMAEGTSTLSGTGIMGTPAYMSPEQARGVKTLDGRSDVYALGILVFQLLTDRLPFEADTPMGLAVAHITEPVPSILALKPDLPPLCARLITRALAKHPDDRYPTAGELARDMKLLARGQLEDTESALHAPSVPPSPPMASLAPTAPPEPVAAVPLTPPTVPPPAAPLSTVAAWPGSSRGWMGVVAIGLLLCGVLGVGGYLAFNEFVTRTTGPTRTPLVITATAPIAARAPTETPPQPTLPPVIEATPTPSPTETPIPTPSFTPSPTAFVGGPPQGHIVFVCFDGDDEICVMNADGSNITHLTDNEFGDFYPSLSPDGQSVFFARQIRGSNYEIFRMHLDGSNATQLTANGAQNYAPTLSPDGTRVVFTSTQGASAQQIQVMGSDGSHPVQLTTEGENIDPSWSPDGRFITFASLRTGKRQIWIMNPDGSGQRQITDVEDGGGRNSLSPDGRTLAFYAGKREDGSRNIYLVNVDGTNLRQLTTEGDNLAPSFSPEGGWIVFASARDGDNDIYLMRPDGSNVVNLTNNTRSDFQPRWGP